MPWAVIAPWWACDHLWRAYKSLNGTVRKHRKKGYSLSHTRKILKAEFAREKQLAQQNTPR